MPRQVRDAALETRTARSRLKVAHKPYYRLIAPGLHLGYRKLASGPGTWIARRYIGDGVYAVENLRTSDNLIVVADDFSEADGDAVLNFAQAQDRARAAARRNDDESGKLISVKEAIGRYHSNLELRGGDPANATRVMVHLSETLGSKSVARLAARDFRGWRDTLIRKTLSPATINRINAAFKAALSLAADEDDRVVNRVWERALPSIPDAAVVRNVVLPESDVRNIIAAAYEESAAFGLFVEVAAVTGARPSQIWRLEVGDVQGERNDPRLVMPASKKGRGQKKILRRPVPIPAALAARLRQAAGNRPTSAPLLLKPSGEAWAKSDHLRLFARVVECAGLSGVTAYALRHSNIVRHLLASVPIRLVAVLHDTSVAMIEKNYSAYIADHSDAISRRALLDTAAAPTGNVVKIR
jgi:integrase